MNASAEPARAGVAIEDSKGRGHDPCGAPPPILDRFGPCTLVEVGSEKFIFDAGPLLSDDFYQDPFAAPAVKFSVKNLLPWTEI